MAFAFAVYLLLNSYSRYMRREHFTKVMILHEKEIKLPTVSLCERNYLSLCTVYPIKSRKMCKETFKDLFEVTRCSLGDLQAFSSNCSTSEYWINKEGCLSMNYAGILKQSAPGVDFGLSFTVVMKKASDVQLRIHDSHEPSEDEGYGQYRIIGGSANLTLHIKMDQIKRLPSPYKSDCTDGTGLSNFFNTDGYSVTSCRRVCRVLKLLETCGVVFPHAFHGIPEEVVARYKLKYNPFNRTETLGVFLKWKKCWKGSLPTSFQRSGDCHCPLKCNETRYVSNIIKATSGTNNTIEMNVHYDSMRHTLWEEVPAYSLSQMMSEFGGLLGLLMGASLFSMLELLAYAMFSLLLFLRQRCNM